MKLNLHFNRQLILTGIIVSSLIILYSLIRIGFLIANFNRYAQFSFLEVFPSFITGLRFDLSSIFWLNVVPLAILNLPGKIFRNKYFERIIFFLIVFINLFAISISFVDYGFFFVTERRISYEVYIIFSDIVTILPGLISNHFFISSLILISTIAIIYFSNMFIVKFQNRFSRQSTFIYEFVFWIVLILFSVIAIRGGLQLKPLRQANAFTNDNVELGYLALNTPYTVIRGLFQDNIKIVESLGYEESINIIQSLLASDNENFVNKEYPFLRVTKSDSSFNKKNVIIFIMESWSANFCGSITGKKSFTPFFDSLSQHSTLFTNFYANGQRSIESLPSIIASIPSLFDVSLIGSKAELNKIKGLGSILKEYGYITSFHHGAKTGSMGFDGYSKLAGFDNYFGKENVEIKDDDDLDGMWGICDEPFFIATAKNIDRFNQPFCSVIFSLSSHDPFRIPDKRKNIFNKFVDESDLEKSIRYSDFSIKQFFEYAKTKSWYSNTIFLITADHTLFNSRKDFASTFHIPLLIFDPEKDNGQKTSKVSSQIDIVPTVLQLLNISTVHSSAGKSALANSEGFAVFKFGIEYDILTETYRLASDFEKSPRLYLNNDTTTIDISRQKSEVTNELDKKLRAYVYLVTYSVAKDKLYHQANH